MKDPKELELLLSANERKYQRVLKEYESQIAELEKIIAAQSLRMQALEKWRAIAEASLDEIPLSR